MAQPEPPPFDPESSPTATALGVVPPSGVLGHGYRLGAYVIESRIAVGGMGAVLVWREIRETRRRS